MKLAEALAERAAIRTKLSTLSTRLQANSKVYEGEDPVEDPKRMLEELNILTDRYAELVHSINTANAVTKASNGETLSVLLARREALTNKVAVLNSLLNSTDPEPRGYRNKDQLREVVIVDVPSLRKEADDLSKIIRETDALIQAANWNTDI
jgi:hypothetical protein